MCIMAYSISNTSAQWWPERNLISFGETDSSYISRFIVENTLQRLLVRPPRWGNRLVRCTYSQYSSSVRAEFGRYKL